MGTQEKNTIRVEAGAQDAGSRIDRWLSNSLSDLSRSRVQSLIKSGRVTRAGRPLACSDRVSPGLVVEVMIPAPEPLDLSPEKMPLDIIHEDKDLIAVNKAPGLVVHPAPGHPGGTLVNALLYHCDDLAGVGDVMRPGIVHRLDRDTSGLILVAKNERAMQKLARQFQEREIRKQYVTIVHGGPTLMSGKIETQIGRSMHDRKRMSVRTASGRDAVTYYEVSERFADACLLKVRIETGRTHQIRVHMAHIHCPVVGDAVYGKPRLDAALPLRPARQMLHAEQVTFAHPRTGQTMTLTANRPDDFMAVLEALRGA